MKFKTNDLILHDHPYQTVGRIMDVSKISNIYIVKWNTGYTMQHRCNIIDSRCILYCRPTKETPIPVGILFKYPELFIGTK